MNSQYVDKFVDFLAGIFPARKAKQPAQKNKLWAAPRDFDILLNQLIRVSPSQDELERFYNFLSDLHVTQPTLYSMRVLEELDVKLKKHIVTP